MAALTKLGWNPLHDWNMKILHRRSRMFVTSFCPRLWEVRSQLSHECARPVSYDNIYHCCTQKTASQWFRQLFLDPVFYRHSGLAMVPYEMLGLRFARARLQDMPLSVKWQLPWAKEGLLLDVAASERILRRGFPRRTVVTHLYIDYQTYCEMPKRSSYRTFFVMRDPRDIVVSWFYSARYSHTPVSIIRELRDSLLGLTPQQGFRRIIDTLDSWHSFEAQRSWARSGEKIFRYEDLAANDLQFVGTLLDFLDVRMADSEVKALCERHSFERNSGGRARGAEDQHSDWRKGVAGDWRTSFDGETQDYFRRVTGTLVRDLGYQED